MQSSLPHGNLLAPLDPEPRAERFEDLFSRQGVRIERIVSFGQATPAGEWLSQNWTEWVAVISGRAGLLFEGETEARVLRPGDWVTILPHIRHRVQWTAPNEETVWLAVHLGENGQV